MPDKYIRTQNCIYFAHEKYWREKLMDVSENMSRCLLVEYQLLTSMLFKDFFFVVGGWQLFIWENMIYEFYVSDKRVGN